VYEEINAMGDGSNLNDLYAMAYERYHGTGGPDSLGVAEKFMKGLEMFEGIYEDSVDAASGNHESVLKKILHLKDVSIITAADERLNGINMKSLRANKKDGKSVLQGRQIWDMGKQVQENGRKVLAIVSRSTKYKDGKVASGEGWEDYLKYCRYKMELLAKAEREGKNKKRKNVVNGDDSSEEVVTTTTANDNDNDVDEDEEAQLIKDWDGTATFPGYMAWALWGHIPMPGLDPEYKSQLFSAKDLGSKKSNKKTNKKNNKGGRTASRSDIAKAQQGSVLQRAAEAEKGPTRKELLLEQQLVQSGDFYDAMEQQGRAEFVRSCINNQLEFLNARLMAVSPVVYSKPECFSDHDTYKDWIPLLEFKECRQEIARLTAELKAMGDEMKKLMADKKKKAATRRQRSSVTTGTGHSTLNVPGEVIVVDGPTTIGRHRNDDEDKDEQEDNEDGGINSSSTTSSRSSRPVVTALQQV